MSYENYAFFTANNVKERKSVTVMTLKHLQTAYIILVVGVAVSSLAFGLEILVFKSVKRRSKIIPFTN